MKGFMLNEPQLQKIKTQPGFIAALDQSGGSRPSALTAYGIKESACPSEEEILHWSTRCGRASSRARASTAIEFSTQSYSRT